MKAYAALELDDPRITELKRKYQPNASQGPHVTLVPPGELLTDVATARSAFESVTPPLLQLAVRGLTVFRGTKMVVLRFEENEALTAYTANLRETLLGDIIDHTPGYKRFRPHVSLARYHDDQQRTQLLSELEAEHLPESVAPAAAVLYVKPEPGGRWEDVSRLSLAT